MATDILAEPVPKRPDGYPFHIGSRMVNHFDSEGKHIGHEYVPLTETDYLHPQEEDRFMLTDPHTRTIFYLHMALRTALRERPKMRIFSDHRIDWQIPGIEPHGPDVAVFDNFPPRPDSFIGTIPVADVGANIVAVFEVTSPSTRHIDFGPKLDEFLDVGIPYYVLIDLAEPNNAPVILAMKRVNDRYRLLPEHPKLGFMIPELQLYFRWENDRLIVADALGLDIPETEELAKELLETKGSAEAEAARADAEKARAEAEKARADALAAELAELKAKLNEAQ